MDKTKVSNVLYLQEIVKAEVFRSTPYGYTDEPTEKLIVEDLIVNAGRSYIAQRIASGDTVASAMAHMAVGSGSTAAALGDTVLLSEQARKALAVSSAITNNVWTAIATFGGNADSVTSVQIAEAGVFNNANSGQITMMQRVTFSAVTLADSDLLKITLETNVGSNTI